MKRGQLYVSYKASADQPIIGFMNKPLLLGNRGDQINGWTKDPIEKVLLNHRNINELDHHTDRDAVRQVIKWYNLNINNTFEEK